MASPPHPWLKPAVLVGGLVPLAGLAVDFAQGTLGANPVQRVLNQLGMLALIILVASLTLTPLKVLFKWTWPIRIRRLVGLLGFFYACLHFLTYVVVDQGLDLHVLVQDVVKRPFITVGLTALVLLVPVAITSTNAMVRRMGFVAWQRLHRLVYVAVSLGVVHFIWRVKKDITEPLIYACVLGLLFAIRVAEAVRKRKPRVSAA